MSDKNVKLIQTELRENSSVKHAKLLQHYFKTGKGEYAEGDVFLGLTVPEVRSVAKKYKTLEIESVQKLLKSKFHEERLCALLILVGQFNKMNIATKEMIYKFYLKNTKYINNWDLVDLSASRIVGEFLILKNSNAKVLEKLAKSQNLWEKRISIISTFAFIRSDKLFEPLKIAKMLLSDKHDLIHKACGWALRELGKKNTKYLEDFLKENYSKIPRTTLRYAIEKFPTKLRLRYLNGSLI